MTLRYAPLVILSLFVLLEVPTAQAQTCTGGETEGDVTGTTGTNLTDSQELGQSFTAPCDGFVASVTVRVTQANDGVAGTLRLYDEATVTEIDSQPFDINAVGDYTVTFDAGRPALTQGTAYRFFFDVTEGETSDVLINRSTFNPYSGGQLYFGNDAPGGALGSTDLAFTVTMSDTALPVELTAFTARLDGSAALLAWETASETSNAGFSVEHRVPEGDYAEAGFVAGAGDTDAPQSYAFTVENLSPGTHAFRLRQVDFDGAFAYSDEVEVTVALQGTHALAVWPNPVPSASGTVRLTLADAQSVTVGLYDALGRRVALLHEGAASGTLEAALPADLPAGVYLVRAEGEAFAETVRVSVVR